MFRKSLINLMMFCLLTHVASAQAQKNKLDSLHHALNMVSDDTAKMLALDRIASFHIESNRDSAAYYNEAAIVVAKQLNQPIWLADFLLLKAYLVQRQSNVALSYKLCMEALAIVEDENTEKNMYIPKDSKYASDPTKYRKSLLINVYHQLGNTVGRVGNRDLAMAYYKKEIVIADEINTQGGRMTSNMNIGSIYLDMKKLDSALIYSKRALQAADITGYTAYEGHTLRTIGEVYFKKGLIDSAKFYYRKALRVNRKHNNLSTDILINNSVADLFESQNQADSMYYYAATALQLANQLNITIAPSAEKVAKAWARLGNVDSAYVYITMAKQVGDSISADRNEKLLKYQNVNFEEQLSLEKQIQSSIEAKNNIRTTALGLGLLLLAILVFIFYRNNRQKQKANSRLESAFQNLKSTQNQLIQSEKMASLGELTAGIAHEIQNPLNFVNNFSEVSNELIDEMNEEMSKGDFEEAKEIAADIKQNLEKITHHGKRADAIVKGMLAHSRAGKGEKALTDLNVLAEEYLKLSYHGLRAKDKSFNADFKTDFDPDLPKMNVVPQDIGRVLLNLINNAFQAVGSEGIEKPTVTISSKRVASALCGNEGSAEAIQITITDNGPGIPDSIKEKIFQPFFTTKPTGQGTGLGLSLSYDIVKAHGGELKVETKENEGSAFIIQIPLL